MVSFTTILALSGAALASPVTQKRGTSIPENWNWPVSGWTAGCARSGCYYNFNVTIPSVDTDQWKIAGVKAYCNGYENGEYGEENFYEGCQILEGVNNGVAAKMSKRESSTDGSPNDILISFKYGGYEGSPVYNFTATHPAIYNQFVAPTANFDVTPTEVFGVV